MATQNGNGLGFDPDELRGKRVLVYSLGIEGRDLARFMVRHGATVTVSDTRSTAQLQAAGAALPDGVTDLVSGRPLLDPEGFDLVAVSQSVGEEVSSPATCTNPLHHRANEPKRWRRG